MNASEGRKIMKLYTVTIFVESFFDTVGIFRGGRFMCNHCE